MSHRAERRQRCSDYQHTGDDVESRVVKPEFGQIDTCPRRFGMPRFGNRAALEDADEESRYIVGDDEESQAVCHNARCPKQTGVHLREQALVDKTNREFG